MVLSPTESIILAIVSSAVMASALSGVTLAVARRFGWSGGPQAAGTPAPPIMPRVGGLLIGLACLVSILVFLAFGERYPTPSLDGRHLLMLLASSASILLLGLLDDFAGISSKVKLLALVAAAAAVCGAGIRIDAIVLSDQPILFFGHFTWPVTMFWICAITVSISFIDGLDGLASGISLIVAGVIGMVAALNGSVLIAVASFALLGALAGFLPFNFVPARIVLGDCGRLFVGFMLATLAIALQKHVGTTRGLMLPAVALAVPLLDATLTLIRRSVIDRRSMFRAEQGHIYHRLVEHQGLTRRQAVVLLCAITLFSAILGSAALLNKGIATVAGLLLVLPVLVGTFRLAGSVRLRHTLAAVQRNRYASAVRRESQATVEEMQNRFRVVRDFDTWWRTLCDAAAELSCVSIDLQLVRRDGSTTALNWRNKRLAESDHQHGRGDDLYATVPVPQRRATAGVRAYVVMSAADGLEMAGQRLSMLTRLLAEHGLDTLSSEGRDRLPPPPKLRLVGMAPPPAVAPGVNGTSVEGGLAAAGLDTASLVAAGRGNRFLSRRAKRAAARVLEARPWTPPSRENPRVAIVHDFLYTYAGAEKVLEQILHVYPDADLFALFDFVPEESRGFVKDKPVRTTFIQRMPFARTRHRLYLPLMPLAIEQIDLAGYDIVISSSYLAAKGVITGPSQLHICYCHSPARYAWDLQGQYLKSSNMTGGIGSLLARGILHYLRMWDVRTANGVDHFLVNSDFVGRRVEKIYRRKATTIYPPVDIEAFHANLDSREDYYLAASRLVPYKRMDLLIEAFRTLPDRRLIIVGAGPELERLRAMAPSNVRLVGHVSGEEMTRYMQLARAFLFAAEEDFGIVLVEAQACGTPAIAFGRGGAQEIIAEGHSGIFFHHQRAQDVIDAIREFEAGTWDPARVRVQAERFSTSRFREELRLFVQEHWYTFADRLGLAATVIEGAATPTPDAPRPQADEATQPA